MDDDFADPRQQQVPGFSFFGGLDYMNKADGKQSVASAANIRGTTSRVSHLYRTPAKSIDRSSGE